jgi:AcrR family transcriptional regulator
LSSEPFSDRLERADRRRNRDVIVAAARDAFARADAEGRAVSMNEVARAAQVGIATLYRHFPSRDELAEAVYQSKLDEVTARVRDRARDHEALASLRIWVEEFASFMLAKRGMMDTLRAARHSAIPHVSPATARIADVVAAFLAAGAADGSIRDDADPMDVTVAILALLSTAPPDDPGTRATRLLELFVDGLAASASNPGALSVEDDEIPINHSS